MRNSVIRRSIRVTAPGSAAAVALAIIVSCAAAGDAAAAPVFLHEGLPVTKTHVKLVAANTSLELLEGIAEVSCRSAKAQGTIAGHFEQQSISGLRLTLRSCIARNNSSGRSCAVHGPAGAGRAIVSSALNAELVPVAFRESFSGVGLALRPASPNKPFLVLEASAGGCLPTPRSGQHRVPVSGGVIGEIGNTFGETRTNSAYFATDVGGYFETSQAIQHPLSAPQLVLSAYGGIEAPLRSFISMKFAQPVQIVP
jgi:hypothetical protein